jgi:hypothetical protein
MMLCTTSRAEDRNILAASEPSSGAVLAESSFIGCEKLCWGQEEVFPKLGWRCGLWSGGPALGMN